MSIYIFEQTPRMCRGALIIFCLPVEQVQDNEFCEETLVFPRPFVPLLPMLKLPTSATYVRCCTTLNVGVKLLQNIYFPNYKNHTHVKVALK